MPRQVNDLMMISVVVPVCNEAESLPRLYAALAAVADRTPGTWELIFVDDGSRDGSWEVLAGLAGRDPRVRAIRLTRNFGQTAAILRLTPRPLAVGSSFDRLRTRPERGEAESRDSLRIPPHGRTERYHGLCPWGSMACGIQRARGRVIVTMDGDLQNDPADIPNLLAKLDEDYDVVCGWRQVPGCWESLWADGRWGRDERGVGRITEPELPGESSSCWKAGQSLAWRDDGDSREGAEPQQAQIAADDERGVGSLRCGRHQDIGVQNDPHQRVSARRYRWTSRTMSRSGIARLGARRAISESFVGGRRRFTRLRRKPQASARGGRRSGCRCEAPQERSRAGFGAVPPHGRPEGATGVSPWGSTTSVSAEENTASRSEGRNGDRRTITWPLAFTVIFVIASASYANG